jgi:hypothetical protein
MSTLFLDIAGGSPYILRNARDISGKLGFARQILPVERAH